MNHNELIPNKMNALVKSISTVWILSLVIASAHAQVGIGTEGAPVASAQLEVRSTTKGFLPPRMTTVQRSAISNAVEGLVVYNTTISQLEYYNGASWSPLVTGNTPLYAQFSGNALQSFNAVGQKVNFPTVNINVGGFTLNSNNTIVLPAGRIYRVDLNLGWANLSGAYSRFAVYNAGTGDQLSRTAHVESTSSSLFAGTGTVSVFINATSGSISIDARFVAGGSVSLNDTNNGGTYVTMTIQTVD